MAGTMEGEHARFCQHKAHLAGAGACRWMRIRDDPLCDRFHGGGGRTTMAGKLRDSDGLPLRQWPHLGRHGPLAWRGPRAMRAVRAWPCVRSSASGNTQRKPAPTSLSRPSSLTRAQSVRVPV
jgi:hypothetical protein